MRRIRSTRQIGLACAAVLTGFFLAHSLVHRGLSAQEIDFNSDVRPILSENCVFCHGPDEATREADLRLDDSASAMSVIQPHASHDSELYRRLVTDDADEIMPPPHSNRKLSSLQIELVRKWIDQGATWEQHWSFRPLVAPQIPETRDKDLVRNPIDAFVQAKLDPQGLHPSPEADRRTLIRRLSLDLTGLPPTPEHVDSFLSDTSPDAYTKLVDRLLDSPAYGQRMAWDWLDVARYADTNGYQGDNERTMWPWRDWVVDAFNSNLPYDEFTRWQLAGDLIPDATDEQILATGFCRNHMINGEGGRIAEENRVEYVMDMSETMGTVWLGLTLNCCRCHDHKYDPLTNKEYYQFFAYFNQTPVTGGGGNAQTPPVLPVATEPQKQTAADLREQISDLDVELNTLAETLDQQQTVWEQVQLNRLPLSNDWYSLTPKQVSATGSQLQILDDGSVLSVGEPIPANDTYTVITPTNSLTITGLRLEALKHESLNHGSLARSDSGNFVLTELEVSRVGSENDEGRPVTIASAEATFEQGGLVVANAFDGKPDTGWAVHEGRMVDREHAAVFVFNEPVTLEAAEVLKIVLRHDSKHIAHNLGRFRLAVSNASKPTLEDSNEAFVRALTTTSEARTKEQLDLLRISHLDSSPEYTKRKQQHDQLTKQLAKLCESFPQVMVMNDMDTPRDSFVLQRGLYTQPTDKVTAKTPEFLPRFNDDVNESSNRLDLANWLVDPNHPLPARVTVNRFWQQLFGIGLVKTTEDFGHQGEMPVHRELLDWLAAHFRDHGWDVKDLIRLIVSSHTYRQSAKITDPSLVALDPDNRLLARGSRYRLPSWMLRDQALCVSGLLSPVTGGPAVNTYQPAGVWEEASFGKKIFSQDSGEKLYRRSLYVFWRRIIAPTMFFDSASRQACTVKSSRTNTPLHALLTLNETVYVESARMLAERVLKSNAPDDPARLNEVFLRVVSRPATSEEKSVLLRGLERARKQYVNAPDDPGKLLAIGNSSRDENLDASEHAVWTGLCLAVLNLDETLNRE